MKKHLLLTSLILGISLFSSISSSAETELNGNQKVADQVTKPDIDQLRRLAMEHLRTGSDREAALSKFFRIWIETEAKSDDALFFFNLAVYRTAKERKLHLSAVRSLIQIMIGYFSEGEYVKGLELHNAIMIYLLEHHNEMPNELAYMAYYILYEVFEVFEGAWAESKKLTKHAIDNQLYYLDRSYEKALLTNDDTSILAVLIDQLKLTIRVKKAMRSREYLQKLSEFVKKNDLDIKHTILPYFEQQVVELERAKEVDDKNHPTSNHNK